MSFKQLTFTCEEEVTQLLIAELSEVGFDVFEEQDKGFTTSVEVDQYDVRAVEEIVDRYQAMFPISWIEQEVERVNWNAEWEKNYQPVEVEDKVFVRATFHETKPGFAHEIVIHPKMSFGTGHHDTTYLMLKNQLEIDHQGKVVYDFGSGTGILAIMAGLLGASHIVGNDVDDWCIENANDNLELNAIQAEMHLGAVKELNLSDQAEIILANINKNILLSELSEYSRLLKPEGFLLLSGFYTSDVEDLKAEAKNQALEFHHHDVKNNWAMLVFTKPS